VPRKYFIFFLGKRDVRPEKSGGKGHNRRGAPAHAAPCLPLAHRPVESNSGTRGNILAGSPNISRGPLGEKVFEFFFKMVQ